MTAEHQTFWVSVWRTLGPLLGLGNSGSTVPESHNGHFTFELRFSENVTGMSYKTLRDHAFMVTGGQVTKARRLVEGSNVGWEIHVEPDGSGSVAIALPETVDCTQDGRELSNSLNLTTIPGPGS